MENNLYNYGKSWPTNPQSITACVVLLALTGFRNCTDCGILRGVWLGSEVTPIIVFYQGLIGLRIYTGYFILLGDDWAD